MPSFFIENMPENIYLALKEAAERNKLSLSQQLIIILAKEFPSSVDFRERRKKILDKIKNETPRWKNLADIDIAAWVREDRDSR